MSFSQQAALASIISGPIATLLTGMMVDYLGPKTHMALPLIVIVKALLNVPFNAMTFYQQSSFTVAMIGIHLEYLLGRGWTSIVMFWFKESVDPSATGTAISFVYLLFALSNATSP